MDKIIELIKNNTKSVAAGVAIFALIGIFAATQSNNENSATSDKQIEEQKISYESEFDLSLGDLKLGMTIEQLQKIKGKDKSIENFPDSQYPYHMYDNMSVLVGNDLIFGIIGYADRSEIKTEKNIHFGSTIDEVFAAYGRDCVFTESGDDMGNDTYEYIFKSKSGNNFANLVFHISDDTVKSIDLNLIPKDTYENLSAKVTPFNENVVRVADFDVMIGNLKLGHTIDVVNSLYPDNNFTEKSNSDGSILRKYDEINITFKDGVVQGIVTHTNIPSTEKNIRKGSSIEEVFSAYGDVCSVSQYNGLTLMEYPYTSQKNQTAVLRFAMNGNIVDYISLRIIPENEKQNLLAVSKNYRQELENKKIA